MRPLLALSLLLAVASTAPATTVVYTNEAAFLAAIQAGYYLEDFSTYVYGSPLDGSQTTQNYGPVNGFSYQASAPDGLWSNTSALSVNTSTDSLLITFTGAPVTAVGGIFTSTDVNGNHIALSISAGVLGTSLTDFSGTMFAGFTSDVPLAWLRVDAFDFLPSIFNWPQLDHFYVGQAQTRDGAIPEPLTALGVALGVSAAAGALRRRAKAKA